MTDELGRGPGEPPEASSAEAAAVGSLAFGRKLRDFRKASGLTIQALAALAELSPGLLSQIERGQTSPSLRTLSKIRTSLGLPSSFFFDDDHPATEQGADPPHICRAADRPHLDLGPGAPQKQLLHHGSSRIFEFMIIDIPRNGRSGPNAMSYPSEKGGYVLEGELTLTVDGRTSVLRPGDSFLFDGNLPHDIYNATLAPTRVLWIIARLPNDLPL